MKKYALIVIVIALFVSIVPMASAQETDGCSRELANDGEYVINWCDGFMVEIVHDGTAQQISVATYVTMPPIAAAVSDDGAQIQFYNGLLKVSSRPSTGYLDIKSVYFDEEDEYILGAYSVTPSFFCVWRGWKIQYPAQMSWTVMSVERGWPDWGVDCRTVPVEVNAQTALRIASMIENYNVEYLEQ